jgi:hypothetical protein
MEDDRCKGLTLQTYRKRRPKTAQTPLEEFVNRQHCLYRESQKKKK